MLKNFHYSVAPSRRTICTVFDDSPCSGIFLARLYDYLSKLVVWKAFFQSLDANCQLAPAASHADIAKAETQLNLSIPTALKKCLLESNGVLDEYGSGLI